MRSTTLRLPVAALLLLAAVGCQVADSDRRLTAAPASQAAMAALEWPSPPEQPRIRYLGSFAMAEDLGITKSFLGRLADTVLGKRKERMVRPTGVAERNGVLYVADPDVPALWIFNRQGKQSIEVEQAGDDTQGSPVAVAPAANGAVFLADSHLAKVFLFDRDGKLVRTIATGLKRPAALAFDDASGRLYVADSAGQCIVVYSRDGARLLSWGKSGTGDGEFNYPSYVALKGGTVLVTDALNYRIQAFDPQGRFLWKLGHQGDGSGDFAAPKGVAIDSEGHVYVVDALFDAVQIFEPDGTFLLSFGERGAAPGEFSLPTGAFIDGRDRIYVADSYNQRVQVFQFLASRDRPDSAQGAPR